MKNNSKLFVGVLLFTVVYFSVTGCKKFLDRKPLSPTLNDVSSVADAQALNLYSILNTYAGFNTLPWLDFNSIRDDDAQKGSSTTDGGEINTEFETFQYTKDDWATNTYWDDHYYMINKANQLLFTLDSLKLTDGNSLRNYGEAHFFRAYAYFELVKAYGEVPKIDFYFTDASKGIKPKSTVADIYTLIDRDLDSASRLLPLSWFNSTIGQNPYPGRATSGAANTLWAQTYLFRGNWARVLALTNIVIGSTQYNLLPNFVDIWKDGLGGAGKNSKESILETQAYLGPGGTPDVGSFFAVSQNVRQGGATSDWNLGWGWNTPTDNLETAWSNTDPRKAATILYSGQFDGGPATGGYGATLPPYNPGTGLDQKYWNKKVYSDPAMRQFTGTTTSGYPAWIDHRILRYADVILMKAEAANESGDGPTAEAMLELVRARARGGNNAVLPHIAYANQAQMRTAIKNERRWEFAMEGYRFYDLVRWGDALSVLGTLGYADRAKYYPIPQKAIDISGGVLIQNPQWP
ncbi:MAG: RagB/SusD family nutrient uptake outer membrane protein [Bacteroidota bacterium]|nr:RagB/SusD family nutrient uptake outer membrane protein [Bacteroidota bacterium]